MPYLVRRVYSNRTPLGKSHENLLEIDLTKDDDYLVEVKGHSFRLNLGELYNLTTSLKNELTYRHQEIIG